MEIVDIITKKRLGKILSNEEIGYVIREYLNGNIKDYQVSSLLMAIVIKGMTDKEIINLTNHMVNSGEKLDLSSLGSVVDKHSTGGVGDKTTMIISPIVASCGVNVAKMSGRGLGHTGGTIDKLESIPGFNVTLTNQEFFRQVNDIGIAIVSQTSNLVPADKKLYALRDVTGTVESLSLIASSIMSKKIASGAKRLVIDIKVGNGALIKNVKDAKKLAKLMIEIGKSNNIKVVCLLTNMDIPLGSNIGNALEVKECIEILENKKQDNLYEVCVELSSYMVSLGLEVSYEEAKKKVIDSLESGRAYNKFLEFIKYQGGSINNLVLSNNIYEVKASKDGYITNINALELGKLSMKLGAGRESLEDKIDYGAGIVLNKKLGDKISKGDVLMYLYTNKEFDAQKLDDIYFEIKEIKQDEPILIYEILS